MHIIFITLFLQLTYFFIQLTEFLSPHAQEIYFCVTINLYVAAGT